MPGTLSKRVWDRRYMTVDLTDAIGNADTVDSIVSVAPDADSQLSLTNVTRHDKGVSFLASDGVAGTWNVTIRVALTGDPAERLESQVKMKVV